MDEFFPFSVSFHSISIIIWFIWKFKSFFWFFFKEFSWPIFSDWFWFYFVIRACFFYLIFCNACTVFFQIGCLVWFNLILLMFFSRLFRSFTTASSITAANFISGKWRPHAPTELCRINSGPFKCNAVGTMAPGTPAATATTARWTTWPTAPRPVAVPFRPAGPTSAPPPCPPAVDRPSVRTTARPISLSIMCRRASLRTSCRRFSRKRAPLNPWNWSGIKWQVSCGALVLHSIDWLIDWWWLVVLNTNLRSELLGWLNDLVSGFGGLSLTWASTVDWLDCTIVVSRHVLRIWFVVAVIALIFFVFSLSFYSNSRGFIFPFNGFVLFFVFIFGSNLFLDQSLGYAFVNYRDEEGANQALRDLNGLRLLNKNIKVSCSYFGRKLVILFQLSVDLNSVQIIFAKKTFFILCVWMGDRLFRHFVVQHNNRIGAAPMAIYM